MSIFKINLTNVEALMMEPLSFYSFSILSIFGLIGLCTANVTFAKTAEAMHRSKLVKLFFVPIANVGLCTGAIVMGMMFGLALGLLPFLKSDPAVLKMIKLLFLMSFFILAILYPLTWIKRSLFDLDKESEKKTTISGIVYCLVICLAFWEIDQQKFYYFITAMAGVGLLLTWYIVRVSKKPLRW